MNFPKDIDVTNKHKKMFQYHIIAVKLPTRLPCPWDSPGKNTGVGCYFLLQCRKVKTESQVTQSCPTLATPWTAAHQAPPPMGFSRQEYWSGVPLPSPTLALDPTNVRGRPQAQTWCPDSHVEGLTQLNLGCVPRLCWSLSARRPHLTHNHKGQPQPLHCYRSGKRPVGFRSLEILAMTWCEPA